MTLEKSVEDWVVTFAEDLGGRALKLTGYTGIPDRLVILPGAVIAFVETKRPKGGKVAKAQKLRHKFLRGLGFRVYVPCTKQEVEHVFQELTA